jgi:outer membrane protein assembly factor BamA
MSSLAIVGVLGLLLASPSALQASKAYKLAGVQVNGAKRYTSADVTKVSGLGIGQPVTVADVTAAADRLGRSGLFKSLSYRYLTKADGMTVIFEFEEADWTVPVLFDNFVWFPPNELTAAVRQDVLSFDGTAPPTEGITELITRSLAALLAARNIGGQVQYTPESDLNGNLLQHVFSVRSPGPRTCAVRFDGSSAIAEPELVQSIRDTVGSGYSRLRMGNVARGTLSDLYRQRGFWRATFGEPTVTLEDSQSCSGVAVRFTVTEGRGYAFDRIEWSGNAALAADKLGAVFGMKAGEVANVTKIDAGIRQVKRAYGDVGHVLAVATYAPRLDDATLRAAFLVEIKGPQPNRSGQAGRRRSPLVRVAAGPATSRRPRVRP